MKIMFGKKKGVLFEVPDISNIVKSSKNESLFFLDKDIEDKNYALCIGVGRVTFVEKGEKLDIVGINFGRKYSRRILVYKNHARRQIFTLKRGQLAWFYGIARTYYEDEKIKLALIAKGFQAWYVPKMLDIKSYDLETVDELEKENENSMLTFLDDLLKGDDDEDE